MATSSHSPHHHDETRVAPIFLAADPLRSVNSSMFSVQTVSIGPLRYLPDPKLAHSVKIQRFKELAVQKICQDVDFEKLKSFLKRNDGRVLDHYEKLLEDVVPVDRRTEIIAYDACFITAFLHCLFEENFVYFVDKIESADELRMLESMRLPARFAPIYRSMLSRPVRKTILQDLLLVENQIPLFAVETVLKMDKRRNPNTDAGKLLEFYVAELAHRALPFNRSRRNVLAAVKNLSKNAKHLLDCMYSIVCAYSETEDIPYADPYPTRVPGAQKLQMSGVILQGHGGSLSDISFKRGVLSIPKIHVGEDTERIFRNLIAYESSYKLGRVDVISYLHFMDCLIDNVEDVELLVDMEIITQKIGSHENVAEMLGRLCKNTECVYSSNYHKAAEEASQYIDSSCLNKMLARFWRSILSIRWLLVSLISAAALVAMICVTETNKMEL